MENKKLFVLVLISLATLLFQTSYAKASDGVCGSANDSVHYFLSSSKQYCAQPQLTDVLLNYTSDGSGGRRPEWTCPGTDGGNDASCFAYNMGICGSANKKTFSSPPSVSALCEFGTASVLSGSGPWTWTCSTWSGVTKEDATCSAKKGDVGSCSAFFSETNIARDKYNTLNYTIINAELAQINCKALYQGSWLDLSKSTVQIHGSVDWMGDDEDIQKVTCTITPFKEVNGIKLGQTTCEASFMSHGVIDYCYQTASGGTVSVHFEEKSPPVGTVACPGTTNRVLWQSLAYPNYWFGGNLWHSAGRELKDCDSSQKCEYYTPTTSSVPICKEACSAKSPCADGLVCQLGVCGKICGGKFTTKDNCVCAVGSPGITDPCNNACFNDYNCFNGASNSRLAYCYNTKTNTNTNNESEGICRNSHIPTATDCMTPPECNDICNLNGIVGIYAECSIVLGPYGTGSGNTYAQESEARACLRVDDSLHPNLGRCRLRYFPDDPTCKSPVAKPSCTAFFSPASLTTVPAKSNLSWNSKNADAVWMNCTGLLPIPYGNYGLSYFNYPFDFTSAGTETCTFKPYKKGVAGEPCSAIANVSSGSISCGGLIPAGKSKCVGTKETKLAEARNWTSVAACTPGGICEYTGSCTPGYNCSAVDCDNNKCGLQVSQCVPKDPSCVYATECNAAARAVCQSNNKYCKCASGWIEVAP